MAQLVVGAAGAVVGYFASGGNPMGAYYGYAIASTLYAVTRPGPHSEGPRLQDLKVTGTEYGQTIPYVFGHPRVPVQIVWSSDKREVANTTTQGKGGGPSYTEYSYEVDLLCILSDNEIAGGARVWDNGKLIYTQRGDASEDSITSSQTTDRWRRITFYSGAPDQLPDPTYEAAVGVGIAPAYRGRGTVFIEGLQLGTSGQLPILTIEVTRLSDVEEAEEFSRWEVVTETGFGNGGQPMTAFSRYNCLYHQILWDANYSTAGVSVYSGSGEVATLVGGYFVDSATDSFIEGQTDKSGLCQRNGNVAKFYTGEVVLGLFAMVKVEFLLSQSQDMIACRHGSAMYFAPIGGGSPALYRHDSEDGGPALAANTAEAPALPSGIACDGSTVFVLKGATTYAFDATTLEFLESFASPAGTDADDEIYCDQGNLYVWHRADPTLYRRAEGEWEVYNSWTKSDGSAEGAVQTQGSVVGGVWYRVVQAMTSPGSGLWRAQLWQAGDDRINPLDETLQSVVAALMVRAGYAESEFDVSALASIEKPVRALAITQVGAIRATLDMLMSAYFFESVLSDKIYFRPRSSEPVKTIYFDDLGASNSPEGDSQPFSLKLRNELEVPAQIAVTYANVADDYQNGTEYSDRALTSQDSTTAVQIALGFMPAEAKGIADAIAMDNVASLAGTTLKVPFCLYPELEASDVVNVVTPDASYRMRLAARKDSGGILEFDAVIDDADALESAQITDEDYVPQTDVASIATTEWEALDIPILRDADNTAGYYAAVKAGEGDIWPGAGFFRSWDDVTYDQMATFTDQAVFGACTTTLGPWTGGNVFDESNTLTVNVGDGELSSSTRDAMLVDLTVNVLLVGEEVIRFRSAVLVSPGVYTLAGLIRGFRGTEWASAAHASGERCVLLRPAGMRRIPTESSQLNVPSYVKAVTFNRPLSTAEAEQFTDTGVALKPFAPVDLRVSRDAGSNATITWSRRTRLSFRFLSPGVDVPIGEAIELYDVEIWDAGFTTLKRTVAGLTTATTVYSAADQVADFGSVPAVIYTRIYQRSAVVGRGYPLQGAA